MGKSVDELSVWQNRLATAKNWAAKIGKVGHGQSIGRVYTKSLKAMIYYQRDVGTQNYHEAPPEIEVELKKLLDDALPDMIAIALKNMKKRERELARAAAVEARAILQLAEEALQDESP